MYRVRLAIMVLALATTAAPAAVRVGPAGHTIVGRGFHAGEHIRLVARTGAAVRTSTVTASAAGAFRAPLLVARGCRRPLSVVAIRADGSRVRALVAEPASCGPSPDDTGAVTG